MCESVCRQKCNANVSTGQDRHLCLVFLSKGGVSPLQTQRDSGIALGQRSDYIMCF